MRKFLEKHPSMSSTFPLAILNGASSFGYVKTVKVWKPCAIKLILLNYGRQVDICENTYQEFRINYLKPIVVQPCMCNHLSVHH